MKALSLIQPWASLVAHGIKRIETRSYAIGHRGPLAIHASKKAPLEAREFARDIGTLLTGIGYESFEDLPLGAVLATVDLVRVERIEPLKMNGSRAFATPDGKAFEPIGELEQLLGNYRVGRFAWFLENVTPLEAPEPARGFPGLWDWTPPEDLEATG